MSHEKLPACYNCGPVKFSGGENTLYAGVKSYSEAHARLGELYNDQEGWTRKTILNIMASGKFSTDRTIAEYGNSIWAAKNVTRHEANHPWK